MSSLPWFMFLTFQVPMRYCSLQHRVLPSSPASSTAEHHFCFGPATALSLGPFVVILHSCPVAHWTPSNLGNSSFGVKPFCPFLRFPQEEHWGGLPFPPAVDDVLSELPLWPVRCGWPCMTRLIAPLNFVGPLPQQGSDPWRAHHWSLSFSPLPFASLLFF